MTASVSIKALATRPLLVAGALIVVLFLWYRVRSRGADGLESAFVAMGIVLLIGIALWLFREGLWEWLDHRALRTVNARDRRRGDWVAVAGRAVALGEELRATLSQRPALACRYQVLERVVEGSGRDRSLGLRLRNEGYHLAPTGIRTDAGTIRLRALPDLVNLEKTGLGTTGSALEQSAETCSRFPPRYAARAHLASLVQDRFDVDWRYPGKPDRHSVIRREWVLSPDAEVCVFGRWDGDALVPGAMRPRGLPVYAGTPAENATRLGGGAKVFFIMSAIPLLAAGWLLWLY